MKVCGKIMCRKVTHAPTLQVHVQERNRIYFIPSNPSNRTQNVSSSKWPQDMPFLTPVIDSRVKRDESCATPSIFPANLL
jgi:hypothetical protein